MSCECENHPMHMCALKAQGKTEMIKSLSARPTVECRHCGAPANRIENICAAHLGETAPNIEGGHGSVSLDDVGKPHAGQKPKN